MIRFRSFHSIFIVLCPVLFCEMILPYLPQLYPRPRSQLRGILPMTFLLGLFVSAFLALSETYDCAVHDLAQQLDQAYDTHTNVVVGIDGSVHKYDNSAPLVFISGVNLSGSELLRDVLNKHPDIRCGGGFHLISKVLQMRDIWSTHKNESNRLKQGGISKGVLDAAVGSFTLELMARSGKPAKYLCHEDFRSVVFADYLHSIFPQSKFLLVVRDPLHYALTKMRDNNTQTGFNETLFTHYLKQWDQEMQTMLSVCKLLRWTSETGSRCKIVHYEKLFLRPRVQAVSILKFIFPEDFPQAFPKTMMSSLHSGSHDKLLTWIDYVPKWTAMSIGKSTSKAAAVLGYTRLGYPPNYHLLFT